MAAPALRPRLFAAVPRDALAAQVAGLDEWVTGKKSDAFHGLVRRFNHLQQFSPVLLRAPWNSYRMPETATSLPGGPQGPQG